MQQVAMAWRGGGPVPTGSAKLGSLRDCDRGCRCIAVDMECQAACSGPDAPTVAQIRRLIVHSHKYAPRLRRGLRRIHKVAESMGFFKGLSGIGAHWVSHLCLGADGQGPGDGVGGARPAVRGEDALRALHQASAV